MLNFLTQIFIYLSFFNFLPLSFILHFAYFLLVCLLVHQFSLRLCFFKTAVKPIDAVFFFFGKIQLFYFLILLKIPKSLKNIFSFSDTFLIVCFLLKHSYFRACVFSSQYLEHLLIFFNWLLFLHSFVHIVLSPLPGYLWFCTGHCVWKVVVEVSGELGYVIFIQKILFSCLLGV